MQDSQAVRIAVAHIEAWSRHDWDKTRQMLAPDVHAIVTSTQPDRGVSDFTGVDEYMMRKKRGASLIEPGSLQVLATTGDERNAAVLSTFRIALGPAGTMVTMTRSCLYLVDENQKIKEERDSFFVL
jgi:ketosteroid isomerase-like protein